MVLKLAGPLSGHSQQLEKGCPCSQQGTAVLRSLHLLKGQMLVLGRGGWEGAGPSLGQAARPPSWEGLM